MQRAAISSVLGLNQNEDPGPPQKRLLLGRGCAAQYGVAVRVAAKAVNDGLVAMLEVEVVFRCPAGRTAQAPARGSPPIRCACTAYRQIRAARWAGCGPARWLPALAPGQGQRVLGKGACGVAPHIARELVQHQDFCQTALGRSAPGEPFTAGLLPPAWGRSGCGWFRPRQRLWRSAAWGLAR